MSLLKCLTKLGLPTPNNIFGRNLSFYLRKTITFEKGPGRGNESCGSQRGHKIKNQKRCAHRCGETHVFFENPAGACCTKRGSRLAPQGLFHKMPSRLHETHTFGWQLFATVAERCFYQVKRTSFEALPERRFAINGLQTGAFVLKKRINFM